MPTSVKNWAGHIFNILPQPADSLLIWIAIKCLHAAQLCAALAHIKEDSDGWKSPG